MTQKEKLPINITFEIVQKPEPNEHWYGVTAILSWEDEFFQRMDRALVCENELDGIKAAICGLVRRTFAIQSVHERIEKADMLKELAEKWRETPERER